MKARLLLPHGDYHGNLLWAKSQLAGKELKLASSLGDLRGKGYFASPFPERDGVVFNHDELAPEALHADIVSAFPWLDVSLSSNRDANTELLDLDDGAVVNCTVIVPLERLHLEERFQLGPFKFVCAKELDQEPEERLADWKGAYLEFEAPLEYAGLLRVGRSVTGEQDVVAKCLTLAEHALDVIRLEFGSFARPEFTPNPAGQLDNGFFAVEIIPNGDTHLKPIILHAIARPMSVSNNWLGPEINPDVLANRDFLRRMLEDSDGELCRRLRSALTTCRQAFYTLGDESRFLALVFAIDGLVHPKKAWTGWTHRTYVAALGSHCNEKRLVETLTRFDSLYTDVRNQLVHAGRDFFEMGVDPRESCQQLFDIFREIVSFIECSGMEHLAELHARATQWLATPSVKSLYVAEIRRVHTARRLPGDPKIPNW